MIDIAVSLNKDKKVKGFQFVSDGKTYTFEGLTYLGPIIRSVSEVCKYYELDASFMFFMTTVISLMAVRFAIQNLRNVRRCDNG